MRSLNFLSVLRGRVLLSQTFETLGFLGPTSLFPKDGGYVVPLKDLVRNAEGIDVGDTVAVRLGVDV